MKRAIQGFLVFAVVLLAIAVHAKTASEVFDAVSSSIVVIRTYDATDKNTGLGSGVVIATDVVATNFHVIENAKKIEVMHRGGKYPATLRQSDSHRDVCTLTVSGINAPAVKTGSTSRLKIGTRVYAIGAPRGLELTLSEGIISGLRSVEEGQYLQISAPISPGSSGGGLFDEKGLLIGLPTFVLTESQQLNFAVPVEWISELPRQKHETRKPARITFFEWLTNADKLEAKEDWAGLLTHSLDWTKAHPKSQWPWLYLGLAYMNTGQTAKAIEACQQSLRINPQFARVWSLLGTVYMNTGQTAKAIEAFQKTLRINPHVALAASTGYQLGIVYLNTGQTADAIEAFQEALRINPKEQPNITASAWFHLGFAYKISGQTAKVTEVYECLKAIDPAVADKFFNKVVLP